MFKFLKEKLKKTVDAFSKKAEIIEDSVDSEQETVIEQTIQEEEKQVIEEPTVDKEIETPIEKEEKNSEKIVESTEVEEPIQEAASSEQPTEVVEEKPEEKKGFFKRLFSKKDEEVKEDISTEKEIEEKSQKKEIEEKDEVKEIIEKEPKVKETVEDELDEETKKLEEIKEELKQEEDSSEPEDIEEPIVEKEIEPIVEKPVEVKIEKKKVEKTESQKTESLKPVIDATKNKKGFFSKIKEKFVKFKITDETFEELFWDFELELMESNVAMGVIEKIKSDLKEKLTSENVSRKGIEDVIKETLKNTFDEILTFESFDLIEKIKNRKAENQNADGSKGPFIISMIGVNGSGKTTTLAKIIKLLQDNNLSCVVSASDTFRAAAIDQLEEHTNKLGVKLIKHDYNSDPAAVAFDAINHAKAKNLDVVLIDTAGRLHSNTNLMDELKKVIRVANPDLKIFIGEAITGNDCVEQATEFEAAVGIDGIILSKADVDENGGAAISISYVTKKPILYLGTGQEYTDLVKFNKNTILEQIGF